MPSALFASIVLPSRRGDSTWCLCPRDPKLLSAGMLGFGGVLGISIDGGKGAESRHASWRTLALALVTTLAAFGVAVGVAVTDGKGELLDGGRSTREPDADVVQEKPQESCDLSTPQLRTVRCDSLDDKLLRRSCMSNPSSITSKSGQLGTSMFRKVSSSASDSDSESSFFSVSDGGRAQPQFHTPPSPATTPREDVPDGSLPLLGGRSARR